MKFRSLLFTPANKIDRVAKGLVAGPDWLALDLEDGVDITEKDQSREKVEKFFSQGKTERQNMAVRINSLSTICGVRDINSMYEWEKWPQMVILPKIDSSLQVIQVRRLAESCNQNPVIMVTLETANGVYNAAEILRDAGPNLAVAFGSADYSAETGGRMVTEALAWARGKVVNAAAISSVPIFDGVWLDIRDLEGLRVESMMARDIGFNGKIAIHPDQIKTINEVFTPTEAEIEAAKRMLEIAQESGGNVFSFDGRMVDAPVLSRAKQIMDSIE